MQRKTKEKHKKTGRIQSGNKSGLTHKSFVKKSGHLFCFCKDYTSGTTNQFHLHIETDRQTHTHRTHYLHNQNAFLFLFCFVLKWFVSVCLMVLMLDRNKKPIKQKTNEPTGQSINLATRRKINSLCTMVNVRLIRSVNFRFLSFLIHRVTTNKENK